MTHSQQPSIDILKKIIASNESWSGSRQDIFGNNPLYFKSINELKLVKKEIEALPQEPTTDELLHDMWKLEDFFIELNNKEWKAVWCVNRMENFYTWYWKTPREALLALKEKLSAN